MQTHTWSMSQEFLVEYQNQNALDRNMGKTCGHSSSSHSASSSSSSCGASGSGASDFVFLGFDPFGFALGFPSAFRLFAAWPQAAIMV